MEIQDHGDERLLYSPLLQKTQPSKHINPPQPSRPVAGMQPDPTETVPPLLRLPTELRREILRYLIPDRAKQVRLYSNIVSRPIPPAAAEFDPHPLAVLRTNRIIYEDCMSVLYSENLFHFIGYSYRPILEFIRKLGPDARLLIRRMRVTRLTVDEAQIPSDQHDLLCKVMFDLLPGLISIRADPWIWT